MGVFKYLLLKEIVFKMAVLNKDTRDLVADRLPLLRKERVMTLRMDYLALQPLPRLKKHWLPSLVTHLTLIISNGIDFQ